MSHCQRLCLSARFVLPVSSPVIENGFVLIEGNKIKEVGQRRELKKQPGLINVDCGDVVLLPGLVNSHSHLDYTSIARKIPPTTDFVSWIKSIIELKKTAIDYEKSWLNGATMLKNSGVTSVADIESVPSLLPRIFESTPLRMISFIEVIGLTQDWNNDVLNIIEKLHTCNLTNKKIGISPHTLYSTIPAILKETLKLAREYALPVSIHLAESEEEFLMFKNCSGPLYNWLKEKGRNMEDCGYGSPMKTFFNNYSPPQGVLVAHANYLDDDDITVLRTNEANIVHCPSSFEYFGHKMFRFDELIKAGINVCLGTDSLASAKMEENVVLDMFYEMRLFSKRLINPEVIVKMATVNGAKALGYEGKCGSLNPDAFADLICIPYDGKQSDVYDAVIHHKGDVLFSLIDGKFVYGTEDYRKILNDVTQ